MVTSPASGEELVLGRYQLRERLGVGASASVWRARDRQRRRDVAIKLLHPHLIDDPAARARLQAEAAVLRRLDHAAVVGLLDEHLDGDQPALVFEHIEGERLGQYIAAHAPLALAAAARIAATLAEALAHAHAGGVVHRDVKPANIVVDRSQAPHLLDFGIAADAGVSGLTEMGTAVGTLPYMAPEQLAGLPADPSSDVYALGAVLYEMLTGRPPYDAPTALAMARQQRLPPARLAGAARAVGDVALASLRHDPAGRPTASVMAAHLERLSRPGTDAADATDAIPLVAMPTAVLPVAAAKRGIGSRLAVGVAGATLAVAISAAIAIGALGGSRAPAATISSASVPRPTPAATLAPTASPAPTQALPDLTPAQIAAVGGTDLGGADKKVKADKKDKQGKHGHKHKKKGKHEHKDKKGKRGPGD